VRRALPTVLLLATAAALPPGAQAARGHLAVRSVSTARSAARGGPVTVNLRAARSGRTRAATVAFYLSTDGKRDVRDVHLAGDARLRAGGPSRAIRIAAQPVIPAGQGLGAYHLIACIGNACRAAKRSLSVTATPVGTRELVAAAVAAHRLTPQQGLLYRVFAATGDRRLPPAYAGDNTEPEDLVMRDVVSQWSTLSASQRATLNPFFTPPAARGSRGSRSGRAASIKPVPLVEPKCDSNQAADKDWLTIAKPGGHVRIWWLKGNDEQVGPRARSLLSEIENVMWPRLVAIFGREPLRDGHVHCFHGIDDKLDIYMWGLANGNRASTFPYPPYCSATPAFIVFDSRSLLPRRWEIAHELTHAFQYSYHYKGSCSSYSNWDEATATWAAAWLYPRDDDEHSFWRFMAHPDYLLADQSYTGWVFPYAMAQLHGAGTIASIYAQTEQQPDVLHAIDAGLPGGLKQAWPEFAKVAWNQDPVEPNFEQWDRFDQHPWDGDNEIGTEQVDVGPSGQNEVDISLGLNPLTRAYRHLRFGPGVTQITVDKPGYAGVNIQAILKLRDGTTRTEDWSGSQPVFCPKTPGERPDEAVLVVSNSSLTAPSPSGIYSQVRLVATNIGCSSYRGDASGSSNLHEVDTNIDESWNATGLVYERFLDANQVTPRFLFALRAGSVSWSLSGTQDGCTVKAGPVTIPVRSDGINGELDMRVLVTHGAVPAVVRDYFVHGFALPSVQGTATCNGTTMTRYFSPHTFLSSSVSAVLRTIPGDGVLEGTESGAEDSRHTATYHWHLAPDR
jgi:hypothetical protein